MARSRRRGRRGEGSVYWSKVEHRWVARFPRKVGGRTVPVRRKFVDKADADLELERLRVEYGSGASALTMTLSDYLDSWMRGYRDTVSAGTATSYEGHIRLHIKPTIGEIVVGRLDPDDVRTLIGTVKKGHKPATVHRVINTLSCAMQQLVDDRKLKDNPCRGVRLPRVAKTRVEPMTEEQALAILAAVKGQPLEPLYRVLLGSGMRLGEACGLDWGDVHLDEKFVVLTVSKTEVRAVPITDDAADALTDLKASAAKTEAKDPVFLGPRTGKRLKGSTASHNFTRIMERAGLGHLHPHLLRHGVATLMVASGVQMRVVSEQLGHKNPALTSRLYAHVAPQTQRDALQTSVGSRIRSR